MNTPLVSVVIPAYNQAEFLAEAIHSVFNQTYQNFEIIVVNDASSDNTDQVVRQFEDSRLKYIAHKENMRLSAARNTGINASQGELIFLLDADDLFHPEKLRAHVDFLQKNPDAGVTYNARFEMNHSSNTIRGIFRPPMRVGLKDLVTGFPFSPSDMVIRREWFTKAGLFNIGMKTAEDTDLPCRFALAGCKFVGIDRALNYRRYHSGRQRKNLADRLNDVKRALEVVFADPRCPADALAIGDTAIKYHLMSVMSLALTQRETSLAQDFILELLQIDPSVVDGHPCELLHYLLMESIADEQQSHEALLKMIIEQLPKEVTQLSLHYHWAVAQGYLLKGIRAAIWERLEDAQAHFDHARELDAKIDDWLLQMTTSHLLNYKAEFGADAVAKVLKRLAHYLDQIDNQRSGKKLQGSYWVNLAFEHYRAGSYKEVPAKIFLVLLNNPLYLTNRGTLSILFRSVARGIAGLFHLAGTSNVETIIVH